MMNFSKKRKSFQETLTRHMVAFRFVKKVHASSASSTIFHVFCVRRKNKQNRKRAMDDSQKKKFTKNTHQTPVDFHVWQKIHTPPALFVVFQVSFQEKNAKEEIERK